MSEPTNATLEEVTKVGPKSAYFSGATHEAVTRDQNEVPIEVERPRDATDAASAERYDRKPVEVEAPTEGEYKAATAALARPRDEAQRREKLPHSFHGEAVEVKTVGARLWPRRRPNSYREVGPENCEGGRCQHRVRSKVDRGPRPKRTQ